MNRQPMQRTFLLDDPAQIPLVFLQPPCQIPGMHTDVIPSPEITTPLRERLLACEEQYGLHFAGHPRVTRDLDMLDALIAEVAALVVADDPEVAGLAQKACDLYRAERATIAQEMAAAGPAGRAAAHMARRASLIMHRYTRHFAGQPRQGRNIALLRSIQRDLDALHGPLSQVSQPATEQLERYRAHLEREVAAILESRRLGTPAQQAAAWGSAANTLLSAYQQLCVGRRQLAVRPAMLADLSAELATVVAEMEALANAGFAMWHHDEAISKLREQLAGWREDAAQTAAARAAASADAVLAALSAELDDVLTEFNQFSQTTPTHAATARAALCVLCDRLDELEQQLRQVPQWYDVSQVATDAWAHVCARFDAFS